MLMAVFYKIINKVKFIDVLFLVIQLIIILI